MQKKLLNSKFLIKYYIPPVLWSLVIFLFSSFQVGRSSQIYWKDFIAKKTAHLIEYAFLAILLYRAMLASNVEKKKAFFFSIMAAGFYGLTDEVHQSFTPGREPRFRDVVIDTIGSTIGLLLFTKVLERNPKWAEKFL